MVGGTFLCFKALDASAGPCARVREGSVALKDSPACVKECAEDGGDCPYAAKPRVSPPPSTTSVANLASPRIKPEHRTCQQDSDCVLITAGCPPCPGATDAVNKQYSKSYEYLDHCTAEEMSIRARVDCAARFPAPVAACHDGICVVQ